MNCTLKNGAKASISCLSIDFPEGVIDNNSPWWEQVDPMMKKFSKWMMDQCGMKIMVFDSIASGVALIVYAELTAMPQVLDAIEKFDFQNWRTL